MAIPDYGGLSQSPYPSPVNTYPSVRENSWHSRDVHGIPFYAAIDQRIDIETVLEPRRKEVTTKAASYRFFDQYSIVTVIFFGTRPLIADLRR
jgi:hypothetical protein